MNKNSDKQKIIAIDGPAGAGKSTVAKEVAKQLGYIYIDTGAMYRALTLKALNEGIDLNNKDALSLLAQNTDIAITHASDKTQLIFMDGHDVSADIRSPLVSQNVSLLAKVPGVREEMVNQQRQLANQGGVVMDGRDIGTNVLPNADIKFFVTATVEERARRRFIDMKNQGYDIDMESLKNEIAARDKMDEERETAPLMQAADAILLDTSDMTIKEVVDFIISKMLR